MPSCLLFAATPTSRMLLSRCLLQGLPEDAREGDLAALFEPVGGIREIRLPRDAGDHHCKGFAFLVRGRTVVAVRVWLWV